VVLAYENVRQLSPHWFCDSVPTAWVVPAAKVPAGKTSAPLSPMPLEVQEIFEKEMVSPLASLSAAGTVARTEAVEDQPRGIRGTW